MVASRANGGARTVDGHNPSNPYVAQRVRVPKMAELVSSALRGQIIRGELSEGDALPSESALMEQFGVSRPTLREAFRVLESESLIIIQRGAHGGARVQPPRRSVAARYAGLILQYQGTTLRDVYDARAVLEAPAAAAVARRHTKDDIRRLRELLESHEQVAHDPASAVAAHNKFHALIVELSGNETLTLLSEVVQEIISQANLHRAAVDTGTAELIRADRKTAKTHAQLIDLIEAGDAEGAEDLWRRHLAEGAKYSLRDDSKATVLDLLP